MILRAMQRTFSFLVMVLASCAIVPAAVGGVRDTPRETGAGANPIRGEDHYVMRDGLRIYLWEKHKAGLEGTFANNGKVALLVHGGTWSGRPLFDLRERKTASPTRQPRRLLRSFAMASGIGTVVGHPFGLATGQHELGTWQQLHRAETTASRRRSKFHDIPCGDTNRFRSAVAKS